LTELAAQSIDGSDVDNLAVFLLLENRGRVADKVKVAL
jgi:hypothetical protein